MGGITGGLKPLWILYGSVKKKKKHVLNYFETFDQLPTEEHLGGRD